MAWWIWWSEHIQRVSVIGALEILERKENNEAKLEPYSLLNCAVHSIFKHNHTELEQEWPEKRDVHELTPWRLIGFWTRDKQLLFDDNAAMFVLLGTPGFPEDRDNPDGWDCRGQSIRRSLLESLGYLSSSRRSYFFQSFLVLGLRHWLLFTTPGDCGSSGTRPECIAQNVAHLKICLKPAWEFLP